MTQCYRWDGLLKSAALTRKNLTVATILKHGSKLENASGKGLILRVYGKQCEERSTAKALLSIFDKGDFLSHTFANSWIFFSLSSEKYLQHKQIWR